MVGKSPSAEGEHEEREPRRARGLVEYRSSALEATAPELSSTDEARRISQAPPIIACHRRAEEVREQFKRRKIHGGRRTDGPSENEESDKARRYDRRQEMNRNSAAASRVRREAYTKALERELFKQWQEGQKLQNKLNAIEKENSDLALQVKPENIIQHVHAGLFNNFPQSFPSPQQKVQHPAQNYPATSTPTQTQLNPLLIPDPATANVQGAVSLDLQQRHMLDDLPPLPLMDLDQDTSNQLFNDLETLFSRNPSADPSV